MVIIVFRDGTDWSEANWVFRQLIDDIAETFPDDVELRRTMEQARGLGGLFLDSMEQALASRIMRAIRTVAERTVDGRIQGWRRARPDDQEGQRMYLESMSELSDIIRRQSGAETSGAILDSEETRT